MNSIIHPETIFGHVLTSSASLTFWQISLFYIYIYRFIYIYITRPTISNYKRKNCILVSCRVFIVKMWGSLTCLCFKYFFFDEKRGEYECIAVAHHQDTALLQTGPWEKCIINRRSYVLKPSYQLPFFLCGLFCTFF